jgi:serine/threonine protein kinase
MGEVYRARDSKLKHEVALKVLPDVFARDPGRMVRFLREAEVLAALSHPEVQCAGVRFIVPSMNIDTDQKSPMGRFTAQLRLSEAEADATCDTRVIQWQSCTGRIEIRGGRASRFNFGYLM